MKQLREFKYQKPNEVTKTNRKVYVLNEDADHIAGIDLDKLGATERKSFERACETFEEAVDRVTPTAFRNFRKAQIS